MNIYRLNYNNILILNADDPNVSRLGKANKKNRNIYYYRVNKYKYATNKLIEAGEGKFCPFCDTRLQYEYYQYAHVGKFKCPKCYFGNNQLNLVISDIDLKEKTFRINEKIYQTKFNNIYAIYNIAASILTTNVLQISEKNIMDTIKNFELNNGRLEKISVNDYDSTINLAKNPTGANVSLRLLKEDDDRKDLLFVLNDNVADGKDVSWIWDINFENSLEKVDRIITAGTRPYDIAIRIKVSGYPTSQIIPCLTIEEAVKKLYEIKGKKYIIANYTSIQPTRHAIIKYKEKGENINE